MSAGDRQTFIILLFGQKSNRWISFTDSTSQEEELTYKAVRGEVETEFIGKRACGDSASWQKNLVLVL